PWSLNRPQVNCFAMGSSFYLEPVGTYSDFLWSNGETTSSIEITDTGTYYVFVPYGEGFIKSEVFTVSDLLNPCNTNSVNEIENGNSISIAPVPVSDYLVVKGNFGNKKSLEFYDAYGREINFEITSRSHHEVNINTQTWNAGIYLLKAGQEVRRFVKD
ncbi:MAG: T9SS type A sorting domain-containing protein, partial [Flavobacteriales bacterium]